MNIITISREFGSGGRELGKRLADELGIDYYDKEILTAISEKLLLDEGYISRKMVGDYWRSVPVSFGRTFAYLNRDIDMVKILVEQQKMIKEIANKGEDFIIVGRNADFILKEYTPFNVFVYADMESKIKRCKEREDNLTMGNSELKKCILRVDKARKKSREILTDSAWDRKESYHLCINTSDVNLKSITPTIAEYIKAWRIK